MGLTQYRSAPLVECLLDEFIEDYDAMSMVACPVCTWGPDSDGMVTVVRERNGIMTTIVQVHKQCDRWFDEQVSRAKRMLIDSDVSKCIILSHVLCRDVIGKLIRVLWPWPPSRDEVSLRVFEYMRSNPGLFP
jgi:uncharacterized protein YbaR (Trm112 family)